MPGRADSSPSICALSLVVTGAACPFELPLHPLALHENSNALRFVCVRPRCPVAFPLPFTRMSPSR